MAEQKQKKAGLTISLGRRPKVLLLGNGMNRVYGGCLLYTSPSPRD